MRTVTILCGIAVLLPSPSVWADDAKNAEERVQAYLKSINGASRNRVTVVKEEFVGKVFPKFTFVAVLFPQFPVGVQPPAPLSAANVLVVPAGDGKVVPITDAKQLEKFFLDHAPKLNQDEKGQDMETALTRSWLRLAQELATDGMYAFKAPSNEKSEGNFEAMKVSGKVLVDPVGGNKGEISATLLIKNGVLNKIEQKVDLKPGPRPICQATKLLDPDPIVRRMAEDSIRVMGSAAKFYLDEQRAKAAPELKEAIDCIWQRILDEGR